MSNLLILVAFGVMASILCTNPVSGEFFISTEEVTWQTAVASCLSTIGRIAIIDSPEKQRTLELELEKRTANAYEAEKFWIGAFSQTGAEGFKWMGGSEAFNYTNWANGEPSINNNDTHADCVYIRSTTGAADSSHKWGTVKCYNTAHFICDVIE